MTPVKKADKDVHKTTFAISPDKTPFKDVPAKTLENVQVENLDNVSIPKTSDKKSEENKAQDKHKIPGLPEDERLKKKKSRIQKRK